MAKQTDGNHLNMSVLQISLETLSLSRYRLFFCIAVVVTVASLFQRSWFENGFLDVGHNGLLVEDCTVDRPDVISNMSCRFCICYTKIGNGIYCCMVWAQ